jgi:large subunit ribosomal protein L10
MISIEEKKLRVQELVDKVNTSAGFYLADFFGIDVEKITQLRAALREKGARMIVVKNTVLRRVIDDCQLKGLDKYLVGPTSIILASEDDPLLPAKVIADFHKGNKDLLQVKAIKIEEQIYEGEKVKEFSKMPGKREMQAQIISIAMGAGASLIGIIKGPGSKIAGQVKSLVEKLENKD